MAKRRADEPNSLNHERREPCEKGEDTFSHKTTQRTQQINNRVSVFALSEFFRGHYAALFNLFAYSEYFVVKKRVFLGAGQESILDKQRLCDSQIFRVFRLLKLQFCLVVLPLTVGLGGDRAAHQDRVPALPTTQTQNDHR